MIRLISSWRIEVPSRRLAERNALKHCQLLERDCEEEAKIITLFWLMFSLREMWIQRVISLTSSFFANPRSMQCLHLMLLDCKNDAFRGRRKEQETEAVKACFDARFFGNREDRNPLTWKAIERHRPILVEFLGTTAFLVMKKIRDNTLIVNPDASLFFPATASFAARITSDVSSRSKTSNICSGTSVHWNVASTRSQVHAEFHASAWIVDPRAQFFWYLSLDTLSRGVGVTQVLAIAMSWSTSSLQLWISWSWRYHMISPRNARQMTLRSDPYRSRKQPLEPIRIFIVFQNDGLVRVNSLDSEEVGTQDRQRSAWRNRSCRSDSDSECWNRFLQRDHRSMWEFCGANSESPMMTRRTKTLPLDSRGNPRRWVLAVANRVHRVDVEISSHREVCSSFIAKRICADVVQCTKNRRSVCNEEVSDDLEIDSLAVNLTKKRGESQRREILSVSLRSIKSKTLIHSLIHQIKILEIFLWSYRKTKFLLFELICEFCNQK